jgi:hypothetical protein
MLVERKKGHDLSTVPFHSHTRTCIFPALSTVVMPVMTPVMVPEFYDHLCRSWNNRSRKHNKRYYSHQQPRQLGFQSRLNRTLS